MGPLGGEMAQLYAQAVAEVNKPPVQGGTRVAPSGLGRAAGWGLFANRPFAKNSTVAVMDGVLVDNATVQQMPIRRRTHLRTLQRGTLHLDGIRTVPPPPGAGLASFANDGTGPTRAPGGNNTKFRIVLRMDRLVPVCTLVATRDIAANEEILVSYGYQYWRRHGRR